MSEANQKAATDATPDLLNTLAGIAGDGPLAALRRQRAEIAGFIQGSYDALLEPDDEAGVTRAERGLVALRVAVLEESTPLIEHYRAYITRAGVPIEMAAAAEAARLDEPLTPRLQALLAHVDRLTREPAAATPEHLAELKAHGLSDANLVTISQLIAFLSFQVRAIVGLQLLGEGL